jgi:phage terminase small subunit
MRKQPDNGGAKTDRGAEARRKLFVAAYLANNKNGTKAAIAAGFSAKSAAAKASAMLKDPRVSGAVLEAENALLQKHNMTAESVLVQLGRIVNFDIRKLYNTDGTLKSIHELDDDTAAALSSFEIEEIKEEGVSIGLTRKVKGHDKNRAIESAMKHFGLFDLDNTLKVTGNVTISEDDAGLC